MSECFKMSDFAINTKIVNRLIRNQHQFLPIVLILFWLLINKKYIQHSDISHLIRSQKHELFASV